MLFKSLYLSKALQRYGFFHNLQIIFGKNVRNPPKPLPAPGPGTHSRAYASPSPLCKIRLPSRQLKKAPFK